MALVGINPATRKQEKSRLEKINEGLQLASNLLQIPATIVGMKQKSEEAAQNREYRTAQIAQTEQQTNKLRADNTPLTPEQQDEYVKMGVPSAAIPKTVAEGRDLATKFVETPQQKASRENQDRTFTTTMKQLELSNRAANRQDEQFDYTKTKDEEERNKKEQERHDELYVPSLGLAYTTNDAKVLKDGLEEKQKFDRKLGEMIELRKKYGYEVLDRSAVSRGTQLSNELLVSYKKMAALGVLSQSDEKIINAVIPKDPLAMGLTATGEDPIMTQLSGLQDSVGKDFTNTVKARVKEPEQAKPTQGAAAQFPRQVMKGNQMATVSNEKDLAEAMQEGWK